jgi:hypothetical protein
MCKIEKDNPKYDENHFMYLALHKSPRSKALPKHFGIQSKFIPLEENLYKSFSLSNSKLLISFFKKIKNRSNLIIEYDGNFFPQVILIFVNLIYFKRFRIILDCHVNSYMGVDKYSIRTIIKLLILYIFKVFFGVKTIVHNRRSLKVLKKSIYCPTPFPNLKKTSHDKLNKNFENDVLIISSLNKDEPVDIFIDSALKLKSLGLKVLITGREDKLDESQKSKGNQLFSGFLEKDDYTQLIQNSKIVIAMTIREYNLLFAPREALQYSKICLVNNSFENKEFYSDLCQYCDINADLIFSRVVSLLSERIKFNDYALDELIKDTDKTINEVKECLLIK